MKITSKHMTEWVQSSPCFLGCCAAEGLRQQHSGLISQKNTSLSVTRNSHRREQTTLHLCSPAARAGSRSPTEPPDPLTRLRTRVHAADRWIRCWLMRPKKKRCSQSVNTTLFCKSTHYLSVHQALRLKQQLILFSVLFRRGLTFPGGQK